MALFAALVLQLAPDDAVRKLIEQLSSDKIEARSEAYRKLEEIGRPALPLLQKAALDSDGEVSSRARTLLVRIPIREHLTPALMHSVSGIYDRLALGDWLPVFLDLAADIKQPAEDRRYRGVQADDLAFMAPMAVDAAKTEMDRINVCQAIGRFQMKNAIPSILKLLKEEPPAVRTNAIGAIRDSGVSRQAAAIRPLLADPSPLVRSVAADALGKLGDKEAVPALRKLLSDDVVDVRWWTVRALGDLKAIEAADDIERMTKDSDSTVRRVATEILSQLRQKP